MSRFASTTAPTEASVAEEHPETVPSQADVRDEQSRTEGGEALMHEQSWYAIWTRSHYERLVAEHLSAKGFTAFLPEMPARRTRRDRCRFISAPMFPGYLFVKDAMTKTRYVELLKVRGIVRVLADGWTRLTPVPEGEVEAIRRIADAGLPVFPHPLRRCGERVRVIEGPLCGVEGLFVQDSQQKGRLVVTVDLLGRSVAVDVGAEDVVRCS